jgi:hypothetical protein
MRHNHNDGRLLLSECAVLMDVGKFKQAGNKEKTRAVSGMEGGRESVRRCRAETATGSRSEGFSLYSLLV